MPYFKNYQLTTMQIEKIKMFEIVELTINANQNGRFYFNSQPQLRNQADQLIIIQGVQVYPVTVYSNSQVTNTVAGVAATELIKAALVLYVNGAEDVKLIPLPQLNNINDLASPFQQEIQRFADLNNVDLSKSYVQFSAAAAGAPYVIPFGISYLRMKRDPSDPAKWIEG